MHAFKVAAKYYYQQVWDLFVSGDVSKFIDDTINKLVDSHGEFHVSHPLHTGSICMNNLS